MADRLKLEEILCGLPELSGKKVWIWGAENGLRKYRPLLAVCIYHNAVDFYSIPLLIKRILPEYKLAVRHHLDDLSETVVYAWI